MRSIAMIATCAIVSGVVQATDVPQNAGVTIAQLAANPARYHGRVVTLSALATVKFEGNQLCAVSSGGTHCIWLEFADGPWETEKDAERYHEARRRWLAFDQKRI